MTTEPGIGPCPTSPTVVPLARQVGQEHDAGLVGNHELGPRLERDRLRGYPASPEHRDFAPMDGDRISVGWAAKISNADFFRAADMNRRAVGMRIASRQLAN